MFIDNEQKYNWLLHIDFVFCNLLRHLLILLPFRIFYMYTTCCMQIKIFLYLAFKSVWLLVIFLALLTYIVLQIQYWIKVVRVDILALFLFLGESIQSFTIEYDISCKVCVDILIGLRKILSMPSFLRVFIIKASWISSNNFFCFY